MGFRNWITKNASKTAETVIVQTKEAIQNKAIRKIASKSNIYVTLSKVGILGLLLWLTGKEAKDGIANRNEVNNTRLPNPNTITINNYIHENRKET
jgi:hypothetical protein